MRTVVVISVLIGVAMVPAAILAAPMDGSAPMLCALSSVTECSRQGDCERVLPEVAEVPTFVRVNVPQKVLSTIDGSRTSPITTVERANGRLMLQGMQNNRVWGLVINEESGRFSATMGEDDGALLLSGACIAP